jgi:hypothetical protein
MHSSINGTSTYVILINSFLLNIPELYVLIRTTCDKAASVRANVHRPQRSRVGFDRVHQRSRSQVVN